MKKSERAKKIVLQIIIRGPVGRLVRCDSNTPIKHESDPIIRLRFIYCFKFLLIFLLVQAGIATKAAVIRPPTILTPRATTSAIQQR